MILLYLLTLILVIPGFYLFKKNNKLGIAYILISLILITGFRDSATINYINYKLVDEYRYRNAFNSLIGTNFNLANMKNLEWLFYIINWNLANIFKNSQLMIIFYSILTNTLFIKAIYKYVTPFWFGIYLYITADLYFFQMSAIRSVAAAAILTLTIEPIINKNLKKFLLIIFVATGIHTSSLVILPIYFINKEKFSKSIKLTIPLAFILMLNFKNILNTFLDKTYYSNYLLRINSDSMYGISILRIIIFLSIYIFIYLFKDNLRELNDLDELFLVEVKCLIFINIIAYILVDFNRLAELYSFSLLYLIPRIIYSFNDKQRILLISLFIICFFIFGIQQTLNWECENIIFKFLFNVLRGRII